MVKAIIRLPGSKTTSTRNECTKTFIFWFHAKGSFHNIVLFGKASIMMNPTGCPLDIDLGSNLPIMIVLNRG